MPKKWVEQGFVDGEPYKLDEDLLIQLNTEFSSRKIKEVPQEFYTDLSNSIGFYLASLNLRKECRPAQIRKNLDSALNLSLRLSKKINSLDWNSRDLIDDALDEGRDSIMDHVQTIISTLKVAREEAEAYPKRGSLPNRSKVLFAHSIAEAIEKNLKKSATTTKDGLFESVLSITLSNIRDKDSSSVHDLARAALAFKEIYPYVGTRAVGGHKTKDE